MTFCIERVRPSRIVALLLCGGLLLTGCKSAEEKAEIHFRSGMSFLEQNDEDRALVEFLNVFRYEKHHEDALRAYADIMRDQGHMREAFGSYMALVERNPDAMDVRVTLAEMSIRTGNWQEARRQGEALRNGPLDDARTHAILLALDYDAAALKRDDAERARVAAEAQELTDAQRAEGTPQSDILLRIVIDNQASAKDPSIALPTIDAALEVDPEAEDLNLLKLRILTQTGQTEATGAQLQRMVGLYPENGELRQALISWHVMEGNYPEAETLLRTQAGVDTGDSDVTSRSSASCWPPRAPRPRAPSWSACRPPTRTPSSGVSTPPWSPRWRSRPGRPRTASKGCAPRSTVPRKARRPASTV